VGISCDFDGGGGGWGLNGDNDAINITVRLLEAGFSNEDIAKIWSGNFFRVLNAAQRIGTPL
jgi:microsomal dipeptidase-like Zn-dependent dipeptidase